MNSKVSDLSSSRKTFFSDQIATLDEIKYNTMIVILLNYEDWVGGEMHILLNSGIFYASYEKYNLTAQCKRTYSSYSLYCSVK